MLKQIDGCLGIYEQAHGKYPTSLTNEAMVSLLMQIHLWDGFSFSTNQQAILDPWQHPIIYRIPGKHGEVDVYSSGPDGVDDDGEKDDISLWAGVNDGYDYKATWPRGRRLVWMGAIIPLLMVILPLRWKLGVRICIAGLLFSPALYWGCQLQRTYLVSPSVNGPLQLLQYMAVLLTIACALQLIRMGNRSRF